MEDTKKLGLEIHKTDNDIRRFLAAELDKRLPDRPTMVEGEIIGFLYHSEKKEHSAKDIMKEFHIKKASASNVLNSLERKGFIRMSASPGDKRKKTVSLTGYGLEHQAKFEAAMSEVIDQTASGIPEEDVKTCLKVLDKIQKNVGGEL
jgi:DNA-binding MarR family transcriptional regulator